MVSANTHSHVDIVLFLANGILGLLLEGGIFQTCNLLFGLDDRLEDVSIIVRVLALHHANQALEAHTRINHIH